MRYFHFSYRFQFTWDLNVSSMKIITVWVFAIVRCVFFGTHLLYLSQRLTLKEKSEAVDLFSEYRVEHNLYI